LNHMLVSYKGNQATASIVMKRRGRFTTTGVWYNSIHKLLMCNATNLST